MPLYAIECCAELGGLVGNQLGSLMIYKMTSRMALIKDGGIIRDVEALGADLFEQSVQMIWNDCTQTEGWIYTG